MSCGEKLPSLMMSSLGGARLEEWQVFLSNTPLKTKILISKKAIFERKYLLQTIIFGIHVEFRGCKLQHVAAFLFTLC